MSRQLHGNQNLRPAASVRFLRGMRPVPILPSGSSHGQVNSHPAVVAAFRERGTHFFERRGCKRCTIIGKLAFNLSQQLTRRTISLQDFFPEIKFGRTRRQCNRSAEPGQWSWLTAAAGSSVPALAATLHSLRFPASMHQHWRQQTDSFQNPKRKSSYRPCPASPPLRIRPGRAAPSE